MTDVPSGGARHGRPARRTAVRRLEPLAAVRRSALRPPLRGPTLERSSLVCAAALPVAGAIPVGVVAFVISGWSPGFIGVLVGVLTWLLLAARRALARRRPS